MLYKNFLNTSANDFSKFLCSHFSSQSDLHYDTHNHFFTNFEICEKKVKNGQILGKGIFKP